MTELSFAIAGAAPDRTSISPVLVFDLKVDADPGVVVHGLSLTCQIHIEPNRRAHVQGEIACLTDLFGDEARWGQTLRPFVWGRSTVMIGPVRGTTRAALPVACSYDLELAAAKYFHALASGEIPLLFLFSGVIFSESAAGALSVERISWDCEARYRLPLAAWRALMDAHWPDAGWLRLDREVLGALLRFKASRSMPSWDAAMRALLSAAAANAALAPDGVTAAPAARTPGTTKEEVVR